MVNKKAQTYYVGNGSGETSTETSTERNPLSNINYIKKVKNLKTEDTYSSGGN
tara:strand:- start:482 stop:640 length:159 start_codon:yes stop_codon:yes gene_type:complete